MDLLNYLDGIKTLPEKPVIISADDGYQDSYTYAFPILKKYGFKMTVFLVTGLIGNSESDRHTNEFDAGDKDFPKRNMLIWPEIVQMSTYGCEFLSHSVTHTNFIHLSLDKALFEMIQSRTDIESHLKKPVLFLAWPYGYSSDSLINLLPKAGYRGAVLYKGGVEDLRKINIYSIKRVVIKANTSLSSYAKLMKLRQ